MLGLALCGCSSSSSPKAFVVGAARTFQIAGFAPSGSLQARRPQLLSFTLDQPSGAPLTRYRRGPGPHTGVHLIIVRSDLGAIIHQHPPVGSDGKIASAVTFPTPGRYRMVVDVYPDLPGLRNFQLFRSLTVSGPFHAQALPPFRSTTNVDGYRFALSSRPRLHAIQAAFLNFTVTDSQGRPVRFTPWYGALAHAIFFEEGSLSYFHTHVCSAGVSGCTSLFGAMRVTGSSTRPGQLRVGVLVPVSGTWRLFLQCQVNGHVLTAPFTLTVT